MNPEPTPEPASETPPEIIRRGETERPDAELVTQSSISVSHRSGPLPPVEDLVAYEEHFPGFGERILVLAEKRVLHDMEMERAQLALEREVYNGDQRRSYQGMWLGGGTILTAIGGGIYAILQNHDTAGAAVVASVVGALAYVFSTTLNQRRQEREAKREQTDEEKSEP